MDNSIQLPGVALFRKCKLTDIELVRAVSDGLNEMYRVGKIPVRMIPARPDEDFDLILGELIIRFIEKSGISLD